MTKADPEPSERAYLFARAIKDAAPLSAVFARDALVAADTACVRAAAGVSAKDAAAGDGRVRRHRRRRRRRCIIIIIRSRPRLRRRRHMFSSRFSRLRNATAWPRVLLLSQSQLYRPSARSFARPSVKTANSTTRDCLDH